MIVADRVVVESFSESEKLISRKIGAYKRRLRGKKNIRVEQLFAILEEIRVELQRESEGAREGY